MPSVEGKVRIKIGDRGAVIKGSATPEPITGNGGENGKHHHHHHQPPTEARPEPAGASTDGSACNTSSASSSTEEEDNVGDGRSGTGRRHFREAESQAQSSDFAG
jgi:hypothetical protein